MTPRLSLVLSASGTWKVGVPATEVYIEKGTVVYNGYFKRRHKVIKTKLPLLVDSCLL